MSELKPRRGRPLLAPSQRRTYMFKVLLNGDEVMVLRELRRQTGGGDSTVGREALIAMARQRGIKVPDSE